MADNCYFVQFPHPGSEHRPDKNGKSIAWNRTHHHHNHKPNPHKRKFMRFSGEWVDEDGNKQIGNLHAWGEWEPESDIIPEFIPQDGDRHAPRYLWHPYWIRTNAYQELHNTDPFIFGDHFLYSNCGQSAQSKQSLKQLGQGSVIAFGSGKNIAGKRKWVLDTVLVVKDSFCYDPRNPRVALEGKVPDTFLEVTGGPLAAWAKSPRRESASGSCTAKSARLRLYRGATYDKPVNKMYSFFPAKPAGDEVCFPRPVVCLDDDYFNPLNWQAPKGATCLRTPEKLRCLWSSLVAQVHKDGLVLGTRAELPRPRVP